ncbi:MAG TPA: tripartite tricarboxylate transporter substrate-binding protein [Ramlibacter sp.]|nr:tripartite tricarboxylate transporter substrate-binding protein [Ramlibacter sp.]
MTHSTDRRAAHRALLALAALAALPPARAQSGPITFMVPQAAGGTGDTVSRLFAQRLAQRLGQTVVVENRPGAGGTVGSALVAKAADSRQLLLVSNGYATWNVMYPRMTFNPQRDLAPVAMMGSVPYTLLVRPDAPFRTLQDLVSYGRSHPGQLSFGSAGLGSLSHLLSSWFTAEAKLDAVHVPYTSTAPALAGLLGGHVQFYCDPVTTAMPQVRGGKARALATTAAQRSSQLSDVPTLMELGYPINGAVWLGIATSSRAPASFVAGIQREISAILREPEMLQQLEARGVAPLSIMGSDMARFLANETRVWTKLVRDNDIKAE